MGHFLTHIMTALVVVTMPVVWTAGPAWADLTPNQVVIVANEASAESLQVARHYALRRGIPFQHIAKIPLPVEETISRAEYERELVGPLRQFLQAQRLQSSVRVLVTVYGVPLRVSAPSLSEEEKRWRLDASDRLAAAKTVLLDVERQGRELAATGRAVAKPALKKESALREFEQNLALLEGVDRVAQDTMTRVKQLDATAREQWYARVESWVGRYQGRAGVTQLRRELLPAVPLNEEAELPARSALHAEGMQLLLGTQALPIRQERGALYRQVEQLYGAYGVFALASLELSRLSTASADAALDSELSLLWWDRHQYEVDWRQVNPLYHAYRKPLATKGRDIPVLMVSRLDAPTPELAARLVDQAMQAERQGLAGTFYLDARGLSLKDKADTYALYDQSLRELHGYVTRHTGYRSVLEDTEARFSRPGEAPDVAFYTGWYRLRQYEDAFTFRPGAIGYHMASAEAISVHRASEAGWCKNALERGITVTMGSVGEPYLDAFPEPLEFAALMTTGQYSLVEAYYLTSRWISWRMVLFGDPLYNPWKHKPAAPRSALAMFTLAPIAPSDRTFDDPVAVREERKRLQEQGRRRLDQILSYESFPLASSVGSP